MNTKTKRVLLVLSAPIVSLLLIATLGLTFKNAAATPIATCTVGGITPTHPSLKVALGDLGCDLITFGDNVTLTGSWTITRTVTLQGKELIAGTLNTILDGNNANRVFEIGDSDIEVTFDTLLIRNGNAGGQDGGGIYNPFTNSIVRVKNVKLSNNSAVSGGGIRNVGTLYVQGSQFLDNQASSDGAAILNDPSAPALTIANDPNDVAVGGELFVPSSSGNLIIANSLFENNDAGNHGGAVYNANTTTVVNSTFFANTAQVDGGGIYNSSGGLTVYNTTLTENMADSDGNGSGIGGGVRDSSGTLTIYNTIISGNKKGASITNECGGLSANDAAYYSLISFNGMTQCNGFGTQIELVRPVTGVMLADIFDTDGGGTPKLAENGGSVKTVALTDYSPALDRGNIANLPNESAIDIDVDNDGNVDDPIDTDQRGIGFARTVITKLDIGAYEYQDRQGELACFVSLNNSNATTYASEDAWALQAGVDTAVADDLLKIAGTCAGVHMRDTVTQTVYIDKNLTLAGGYEAANWANTADPAANPTLLDAQNSGRVVYMPDGGYSLTLSGLIIANGNESNGGGIWTKDNLVLEDSIIRDNTAANDGGGLWIEGADLTIRNSLFQGNAAGSASSQNGGGMKIKSSNAAITNTSILSNTGRSGAGIWVGASALFIEDSTIAYNIAANQGGGVNNDAATTTLVNSTVSHNVANGSGFGGGIININSSTGVTATLILSHTTVFGNNGNVTGGIENASINDGPVETVLSHSIVAGNSSNDCNSIGTASVFDSTGDYNVDSDGSCIAGGGIGNITDLTPGLLPLAENGGAGTAPGQATLTNALLASSPAIDRIPPGSCGLTEDQRDIGRPQLSGCDSGAYELELSCPTFPISINTESELNNAIFCFNAVAAGGTYTISVDADINLSASTLSIDNATNDVLLSLEGGEHRVDGQNIAGLRVFDIAADTDVAMSNLTISGGNLPNEPGGGIRNLGTLSLSNSHVLSNTATNGGGIRNQGTLTVSNTIFQDNQAHANQGGGIRTTGTSIMTILGSRFVNNHTASDGGAIFDIGSGNIFDSHFENNQATSEGGAVFIAGDVTIQGSLFTENKADAYGGALFVGNGDNLTLLNSTLSDNFAGNGGGGLADNTNATTVMRYTTIYSNSSNVGGGGLDLFGSVIEMNSSILAGNLSGGTPKNVAFLSGATLTSLGNNLEDRDDAGFNGAGDLINIDPQLEPLADNGGKTWTHALLANSPALGNGDSANCVAVDQRGVTRPQNTNCDIGAYELWRLEISADNPTDAQLSWQDANASCTYDIFESTTPYFTLVEPAAYPNVSSSYPVNGRLGDVNANYFFINRVTCNGDTTGYSNEVGEFDFAIVPGGS